MPEMVQQMQCGKLVKLRETRYEKLELLLQDRMSAAFAVVLGRGKSPTIIVV